MNEQKLRDSESERNIVVKHGLTWKFTLWGGLH
jgi:hypothetical protein